MTHIIKHINGSALYDGESGMTTRQALEKATAAKANLYGADLSGAYLYGANLSGADLRGVDLSGAYLYGANLRGAYLYGANLRGANLYGADMYGADLGDTIGKLIGDRPVMQIGPIGSRADTLLCFLSEKGVFVRAGCFTGTIDEFAAAVEKEHGDSKHGDEYRMAILMMEAHAVIWMPGVEG